MAIQVGNHAKCQRNTLHTHAHWRLKAARTLDNLPTLSETSIPRPSLHPMAKLVSRIFGEKLNQLPPLPLPLPALSSAERFWYQKKHLTPVSLQFPQNI